MPYQGRQYKTPADYVPKHRIPDGWAGSTPRGPHRWARAAHNALTSPNSEAARLYQKRVRLACEYREIVENLGADQRVTAFMKWAPSGAVAGRDYVVCSHYCAAMQAQLDRGATTIRAVIEALADDASNVEHSPTLTRDVRCQCCGSTIRRNS